MKIFIIVSIMIISYLVGTYIIKTSKVHLETLKDVVNLIECLKIHINYSSAKIYEIINEFTKKCKTPLKNMINNKSNGVLYQNEYIDLEKLLSSLGKSDLSGQNLLLEKYKLIFDKYIFEAVERHAVLTKTTIKLTIAVGVLICLLIL